MDPQDNTRSKQWYKDTIMYELHVRAFFDSDNDGIGDFRGLVQKLDYLADLGITAIWLLPFYPSPLRDDGYDIADYFSIHPNYGTIKDFKYFLSEAHRRGIRVITELVINHTSDQHEWFQKSRRAAPGSFWRDFYVWSDDPSKYKEARIIFKDFETSNWSWDPVAKSYFWHRFYSHQPDLNFENENVRKAILEVVDFWFEMGVDGMRLDAVPYLFEEEGSSCENLPETHTYLKSLRSYIDEKYPEKMLLAEANQWPEDAVAYFGEGDECHMCFHFPLMPRLFMALRMEDRFSIIDILRQTPEIPSNAQWATFLRNHDELTLEMVTDEERDYMYKMYASDDRARINLGIRRRLAPLMGNDRKQIELLNILLFSLPGAPVIYYGDEIGMGDNIFLGDRDGVRTPQQWSPDRNAGFSRANPQSLYLPVNIAPEFHYEATNVENQETNPNSLLWWMKKLISLRKQHPELSRGSLRFLDPENSKVLVYLRELDGKTVMIVANLSKRAQFVELDLSEYSGMVPVELFGQSQFPRIGELPYLITLGPYAYHWFEFGDRETYESTQWLLNERSTLNLPVEPLEALTNKDVVRDLEKALAVYLPTKRWFANKNQRIHRCQVVDVLSIKHHQSESRSAILLTNVEFLEAPSVLYLVTLTYSRGERAERILEERPDLVLSRFRTREDELGVYHEALLERGFCQALLTGVLESSVKEGRNGELYGTLYDTDWKKEIEELPEPTLTSFEQSNSSVLFGKQFYLKIFRKVESGANPELEIGRHFFRTQSFKNLPTLVGSLNYHLNREHYNLGVVQKWMPSQGDAWTLILDQLSSLEDDWRSMENLPSEKEAESVEEVEDAKSPWGFFTEEPSSALLSTASYSLQLASQLGERTAEMHLGLAVASEDLAFEPELFTPFHQRSFYQSLRNLSDRVLKNLRIARKNLEGETLELADWLLDRREALDSWFSYLKTERFDCQRIRVHGDYHLGQVLFTGKDFTILDFEGEPARSLEERRLKRSPLKDVAGMMRSFEYAAYYFLKERAHRSEDIDMLTRWLRLWKKGMSQSFFSAYCNTVGGSKLIPQDQRQLTILTEIFLIEKALYELNYELSSRPDWVVIPLQGLKEQLRGGLLES